MTYRADVKKKCANGKKEGDKHFALPRKKALQTSCAIASTGWSSSAIRIAGHFLVCYRAIHAIQQPHFFLFNYNASPDPKLSLSSEISSISCRVRAVRHSVVAWQVTG